MPFEVMKDGKDEVKTLNVNTTLHKGQLCEGLSLLNEYET